MSNKNDLILVPISIGELLDKITILELKFEKIEDAQLKSAVQQELNYLLPLISNIIGMEYKLAHKNIIHNEEIFHAFYFDIKKLFFLIQKLKGINNTLWEIEDKLRDYERSFLISGCHITEPPNFKIFDAEFIQLARLVYITNDKRSAVKNDINTLLGSELKEVKSYSGYGIQNK